ncbi:MAG: putative undecaprenyl-phosphate N-acetylglucosaminyl 1-phosphate transferase [Pedosphaera sp.]|nr:putative undecaprenyl-phosphate N-acetylglucosaminyl 1-phosphate transferase [Pedosphaera sp.]
MTYLPGIFCAMLGMLITWCVIPVIQRRLGFLNRGDLAQFHHAPGDRVSRLGGLALALAFVAVALAASFLFPEDSVSTRMRWTVVGGSLLMFLLGLCDDLRPLGAKRKLLGQILIASAAYYGGVQIQHFKDPFHNVVYQLGVWSPVVTVFWMVALTNLINLIDGIDGLAGGIALMLMGLLAYFSLGAAMPFTALCAAGMVGALLGFLRFNFPPAQIYMGDGGAYFIGFLIASLAAVNSHKGTIVTALIAPLFVLALPIVDVSVALIRRGLRGLPLFRADRKHIHHRLVEAGLSRRRAVLTLYFISLIFLMLALCAAWLGGRAVPLLLGVGALVLLAAARAFRFSRKWFSIRQVLCDSLEQRKATRYALTLGHWLEMEADRSDSMEELWCDFQFMAGKLGFAEVKLTLADEQQEWREESGGELNSELRLQCMHFQGMKLEFAAKSETMTQLVFEHVCELCAEAWHKAATRWGAKHRLPVCFASRIRPAKAAPQPSAQPVAVG